jgi:hypothetical protein
LRAVSLATEHIFDYQALFERPAAIGHHPYGTRLSYKLGEGSLRGARLSAKVLGGDLEWLAIDPDGWARIEVRGQCRTDDGALLYTFGDGLIEPSTALTRALHGGAETSYEDQYWRAALRVQTADRRYRWLEHSTLLARGRICAGPGVECEVFRVC